jgi:hypothetical protein
VTAPPPQKPRREYQKTGAEQVASWLIDLGSRAIDGRSSVGVALRKWKADLIAELGRELAVRSKIYRFNRRSVPNPSRWFGAVSKQLGLERPAQGEDPERAAHRFRS